MILSVFNAKAQEFELVTEQQIVSICYPKNGNTLDSISAYLLAKDIEMVSGKKPIVTTDIKSVNGNVIILGLYRQSAAQKFKNFNQHQLQGKWESFSWQFYHHPKSKINKALVITGSDSRGLAYGIFKLSKQIGVNPWYWWADVVPVKNNNLSIPIVNMVSKTPSVKYRGIFINDEDWGLRPWAANNLDKQIANIGPKTYQHVFELLLRLNANLIWPAMHPGTKAFFSNPENLEIAKKYQIIIGSSHAEPMLRNNVDEWNQTSMGSFNYLSNKTQVLKYWQQRLIESKGNELIYTMGMRGIHDSGMEGVKSNQEAIPVLQQVIKDQQQMLSATLKKTKAPQVFTLYKEVLDIYDEGLKVPDDITLVWPDDNYGYIRRLNSPAENSRKGGSGVYYHASYWGRPHDYLWLSTTHPALMREEMVKAWNANAKEIWVLNVGDIKPAEYQTQLFLDMAFDITPFQQSDFVNQHLTSWYQKIFQNDGQAIANVIWESNRLATERKPEFMGWSQTEPTTPTKLTAYQHFAYGDEAQNRINLYTALANKVNAINSNLPLSLKDAFFQLVDYPIIAALNMNKKFIYHDKVVLYGQQGRLAAAAYQDSAVAAYQEIIKITKFYNDSLANGKWNGMMSMAPRNLPVFEMPKANLPYFEVKDSWDFLPEGNEKKALPNDTLSLPLFYSGVNSKYFIDLFLTKDSSLSWGISADINGIEFSNQNGYLSPSGELQKRIWVNLNPRLSFYPNQEFIITIKTNLGNKYIKAKVGPSFAKSNIFKEWNGIVSIFAAHYSSIKNANNKNWTISDGLGYTGNVMIANQINLENMVSKDSAILSYDFLTTSTSSPTVHVYTVPTHPLNNNFGLKYAIRIDNSEWQIQDFTTQGRSKTWKENVLSNQAEQKIVFKQLNPGKHQIEILAIDPGVMIDRLLIDLGGLKPAYSVIKETR